MKLKFGHIIFPFSQAVLIAASFTQVFLAEPAVGLTNGQLNALTDTPIYGVEFEFSADSIFEAVDPSDSRYSWLPTRDRLMRDFILAIEKKAGIKAGAEPCLGCARKIVFPDGFWISIKGDPMVIEVTSAPQTKDQWQMRTRFLNEIIFETAREQGLVAGQAMKMLDGGAFVDGGHFNVGFDSLLKWIESVRGTSSQNRITEAYLSLLVDHYNNPFLDLGVLGFDLRNAPPLSVLQESQRNNLENIIKDFRTRPTDPVILVNRIVDTVHTHTYDEINAYNRYSPKKFQSVSMQHLQDQDRRLWRHEYRANWAQDRIDQLNLRIELYEARGKFVMNANEPILYTKIGADGDYTNKELVNLFWVYVTEMGESFEKYRPIMGWDLAKVNPKTIFHHKKPKWESESYRSELLWWIPHSLSSHWLRDKLATLLSNPSAYQYDLHKSAIDLMMNTITSRGITDPMVKTKAADFFISIAHATENPKLKFALQKAIDKSELRGLIADEIFLAPRAVLKKKSIKTPRRPRSSKPKTKSHVR